jgi:hypothetical protein
VVDRFCWQSSPVQSRADVAAQAGVAATLEKTPSEAAAREANMQVAMRMFISDLRNCSEVN